MARVRGQRKPKGVWAYDVPAIAAQEPRKTVDELRAAVVAATTTDEFEAARRAIRAAMSPGQCDGPDLYAVCEAKRIAIYGDNLFERKVKKGTKKAK